jgi:hypothetical protein
MLFEFRLRAARNLLQKSANNLQLIKW